MERPASTDSTALRPSRKRVPAGTAGARAAGGLKNPIGAAGCRDTRLLRRGGPEGALLPAGGVNSSSSASRLLLSRGGVGSGVAGLSILPNLVLNSVSLS